MRRALATALAAALAILAMAGTASAASYTVNSLADGSDTGLDGVCDGSPDPGIQCTLRAALQETNNQAGSHFIGFARSFEGGGDTVQLQSSNGLLPYVERTTEIDGCSLQPGHIGPCVGLRGGSLTDSFAIGVRAAGVAVRGLAITNVSQGVFHGSGATGLNVQNNWFGVRMNGTRERVATGVSAIGDGATIGGASQASRNVFAAGGVGVSVWTADNTSIRGNIIGLMPDGATDGELWTGIELAGNMAGNKPVGTTIGGQLYSDEFSTAACDGPCNVISGNVVGINFGLDVPGQYSAPGATTIQANYIGFDAGGSAVRGNETGIRLGHADDVRIGGGSVFNRNRIAGGLVGIDATAQPGTEAASSGIEHLEIANNHVGADAGGNVAKSPPAQVGIAVDSPSAGPAKVTGNLIALGEGAGIRVAGSSAAVQSNRIGVGTAGADLGGGEQSNGVEVVQTAGTTAGNRVEQNVIGFAGGDGILIRGADDTIVASNRIGNDGEDTAYPNGRYGIGITDAGGDGAHRNLIGSVGGNTISHSGQAAIAVLGTASTDNEVLNTGGHSNGPEGDGPFIDLGGDGHGNPTGANGAPEAPVILSAGANRVTGLGQPGATVRVHAKTMLGRGELGARIGTSATVDSEGRWSFDPGTPISVGTVIAAIQNTAAYGSSEVSARDQVKAPSDSPDVPPETTVVGPDVTTDASPSFELRSSKPVGNFLCRVAGQAEFSLCSSPYAFEELPLGEHWLQVAAIDTDGNIDPTPVTKEFEVIAEGPTGPGDPTDPGGPTGPTGPNGPKDPDDPGAKAPDTRFAKKPPKVVRLGPGATRAKVTLRLASTVPGSTYRCKVGRRPWKACKPTRRLALKPGRHRILAQAISPTGQKDPSPAKAAVRVTPQPGG